MGKRFSPSHYLITQSPLPKDSKVMQVKGGCSFKFPEVSITIIVTVQPSPRHRSLWHLPTLKAQWAKARSSTTLLYELPSYEACCEDLRVASPPLTPGDKPSLSDPPAQGRCHPERKARGGDASGVPGSEGSLRPLDRCHQLSCRTSAPVQLLLPKEWELSAVCGVNGGPRWLCPVGESGGKGQSWHREEGCSYGSKRLWRHGLEATIPVDAMGEEGSCSGTTVLEKRQPSDRDPSGKKEENSHNRCIQGSRCTWTIKVWEGTGWNTLKHLHDLAIFILETDQF